MTTKELAEKNPFFTWEQFRQEAGVKETTGYARLQAAVKSNYVEQQSKGIYVSHVGPWMEKPPSVFLLPAVHPHARGEHVRGLNPKKYFSNHLIKYKLGDTNHPNQVNYM